MCPFPNWVMVLVYVYIHAVFVVPVYDQIVQAHLIVSQHGPMSSFFFFLKRVSIYRIRFWWWLFIIISRHQLIFGGSGNWILDLLFNYQILYQLEPTTHWAAFVFSIFDLQNVFLPKAFSKAFVFFLLKVFGSSIKLKKKSIKVKSKYFLSLEFRFKKPFSWN